MKKLLLPLLLITVAIACKKPRTVIVYNCTCKWVRASTHADTSTSFKLPDFVKGTAQSSCDSEKEMIPNETDVKDSVSCNLY